MVEASAPMQRLLVIATFASEQQADGSYVIRSDYAGVLDFVLAVNVIAIPGTRTRRMVPPNMVRVPKGVSTGWHGMTCTREQYGRARAALLALGATEVGI